LRVYGDYLGNPDNDPLHESLGGKKARRPDMSYDIYRKDYSETTSDSHLLGSTRETEYMDATFNQLADGDKCRYGVIVRYGSEAASPVYSNVVTKGGAGVSDIHINQMDFGFNSQSGMLTIGNPELVKEIRIYSTDGRCAKVIGEVSQYVMIDGLTSGIYMISLISTDNSMVTKKVVKK
ncbi:MAG: T9SS type A sorting domain-containing protein, partial [Muribaculaceae bacterium]|nr:T9SS type A sorting domain-containing protein [Muribaculaceae bacterium]